MPGPPKWRAESRIGQKGRIVQHKKPTASSLETSDSGKAVARRIIRFLKQIEGSETEEQLLSAAIARRWLDQDGAPTPDGERLVAAFEDLERFTR